MVPFHLAGEEDPYHDQDPWALDLVLEDLLIFLEEALAAWVVHPYDLGVPWGVEEGDDDQAVPYVPEGASSFEGEEGPPYVHEEVLMGVDACLVEVVKDATLAVVVFVFHLGYQNLPCPLLFLPSRNLHHDLEHLLVLLYIHLFVSASS